jgi:hypothetical protein
MRVGEYVTPGVSYYYTGPVGGSIGHWTVGGKTVGFSAHRFKLPRHISPHFEVTHYEDIEWSFTSGYAYPGDNKVPRVSEATVVQYPLPKDFDSYEEYESYLGRRWNARTKVMFKVHEELKEKVELKN